ncbi:MAG TPA: hypothetical protein VNT99_05875, partial [Methylomirabilota bacterium]|nr:hypothetical protein [Methylomirabilota bacterium]
WDYEGHRMVNELALTSLPSSCPAFVRAPAAAERIMFLAGEPDRWRNSTSPTARHGSAPDHFFDIDELPLYGLTAQTVSPFRYDFTAQLKLARDKHPSKFPRIDPSRNSDHTRDLLGFLPWALNEHFAKLQSAFSYLKTFEQYGGTAEEIANAQQNVIYVMGVMGHYAGDAAQPLHTTKHYNGWVGENPNGYNTNKTIHSWIDGGFIRKAGINAKELKPRVRTAKMVWTHGQATNEVFGASMQFLVAQAGLVERLYQLDRAGELSPGKHDITEGRAFIGAQVLKGAQFLGDLWFSAWQGAFTDTYLANELKRRREAAGR